jgi:hypothetical protein
MNAKKGQTADAPKRGLVNSRLLRRLSIIYPRPSALIRGWIYSFCLRVNSRQFAVEMIFCE